LPDFAFAAMAYRVPQARIEAILEGLPLGFRALVVDGWEGITDLPALARKVDVLDFAPQRRGFGVARSTALATLRIAARPWSVIFDADGHHAPDAIADTMREVLASDWAAAIPQRTNVHLPLHGEGTVDRIASERLEASVVAHVARRPDLQWYDFQPGLYFLTQQAMAHLQPLMQARAYAWDLEVSCRLLQSGMSIGFPTVHTSTQDVTSFTVQDAAGNLRSLRDLFGEDNVRHALRTFETEGSARLSPQATAEHAAFARQWLANG
jgi:hypothetical protein